MKKKNKTQDMSAPAATYDAGIVIETLTKENDALKNACIEAGFRGVPKLAAENVALIEEVQCLKAQLAEITKDRDDLQRALEGQADAAKVFVRQTAAAGIPDDDPEDPRPAFDPVLGWQTPDVLAWAERRKAKLNH